MPPLVAQKLQELRHTRDVVDCGRVRPAGQVVASAPQSKSIAAQRDHSLDGQVQIDIKRISVGVECPDHRAGLIPHREGRAAPRQGQSRNCPILPRQRQVRPSHETMPDIPPPQALAIARRTDEPPRTNSPRSRSGAHRSLQNPPRFALHQILSESPPQALAIARGAR